MHELCGVLGFNFMEWVHEEVDQSVGDINHWLTSELSAETTARVKNSVQRLLEIRSKRFNEVKQMGLAILAYWNVLSISADKKRDLLILFYFVNAQSEDEITEANGLSLEFTVKVENEFKKLDNEMKELIREEKCMLENILQKSHLTSTFIDKGILDSFMALEDVRSRIAEAKDLCSKRKDIVTGLELLQFASQEIEWHIRSKEDDISKDDGRTARAKISAGLYPKAASKIKDKLSSWTSETGEVFEYDGDDAQVIFSGLNERYGELLRGNTARFEKVQDEEPKEGTYKAPSPLVFGRRATRTPRVPVQADPPSPQDSDQSDESMYKSDPNDSDFDPEDSS